jgi:general secretion pathway protein I
MNAKGFTLLEVMIALALLSGILFVAVISQTSSLASSTRSKNILMATNLARNLINEQELKYEGTPFDRLPKTEEGSFADPHQEFKWEIKFEEVDFSVLSSILLKQAEANNQEQDTNNEMVAKLFQEYLKKSVRKMVVVVKYPDSGATSNLTFSQLLVNYDADFASGI